MELKDWLNRDWFYYGYPEDTIGMPNYFYEDVLDLIPIKYKGAIFLDAGCGAGNLLRKIRTIYPEAVLVGLDINGID